MIVDICSKDKFELNYICDKLNNNIEYKYKNVYFTISNECYCCIEVGNINYCTSMIDYTRNFFKLKKIIFYTDDEQLIDEIKNLDISIEND